MSYKDFIDFEIEQVYVVNDTVQYNMMNDSKFIPIFQALKEGPLTIKELVDHYNLSAEKPKKQTSIYNYLTDLIKNDLIVKAGLRVVSGKTATEVLYARRAKIYYLTSNPGRIWQSENSQKLQDQLLELVNLYTKSKFSKPEDLSEIVTEIYSSSRQGITEVLESNADRIRDLTSRTDFNQLRRVTELIEMLLLLLNVSQYKEKLEKNLS